MAIAFIPAPAIRNAARGRRCFASPNDPALYASYAQAAQRSGDVAATHATMAEYHYLNGELLPAIEQLEQGLRNPGLSPNQEAQLRARLKQIRAEAIAQGLPVPKRDAP